MRWQYDTIPACEAARKRYQRDVDRLEQQDANLFSVLWNSLEVASVDRLTRDCLEEYTAASAKRSGLELFKFLMKSYKPTVHAAMLAYNEMWEQLVAYKQTRSMPMEINSMGTCSSTGSFLTWNTRSMTQC